jgi:hypothetical protein
MTCWTKSRRLRSVGWITSPSRFRSKRCWRGSKNQLALHQQREGIAALLLRNEQPIALATDELRPQRDQIAGWAAALRDGGDAALAEQVYEIANRLSKALDGLLEMRE